MPHERPASFPYPVVDLDSHVYEQPEIFTGYLDERWREPVTIVLGELYPATLGALARGRTPAMTALRGAKYRMGLDAAESWPLNLEDRDYVYPGAFDPHERLASMDAEGIDVTIVRNTLMAGVTSLPDPAMVDALCRAYNDWVGDFCAADPRRLVPEALLPTADPDRAVAELERTAAKGFRGVIVAGSTPGPPLSDPHWEPLFARMQEMGWPLCVHAALNNYLNSACQWLADEKIEHPVSGPAFYSIHVNLDFVIDNLVTLGEITLGGMADRFPDLNVYFVEGGHSWVGEVLYRLDKGFHCPPVEHFRDYEPRATTPPSEIFERQVFVAFEGGDRLYLSPQVFDRLARNLVWTSDIPHWDADGPWEAVGALRALGASEAAERAVMGGNAARLLGVPHEKRVGTSPASPAAGRS
ncbi:MAG: amidohydrolase [Acidimicrobiia bacterium]|nr:amidohydrolase [Acidimicrobiia bacterium]